MSAREGELPSALRHTLEENDLVQEHATQVAQLQERLNVAATIERREQHAAARYEELKNALFSLWGRWNNCNTPQGEEEKKAVLPRVLSEPLEIVHALERCFAVHATPDGAATYIQRLTGSANSIWLRHLQHESSIKGQPILVLDRANQRLDQLRTQLNDAKSLTEIAQTERAEAISHLRTSERARRVLEDTVQHLRVPLRLPTKGRITDSTVDLLHLCESTALDARD